jgi:hypothetical protein
MVCIPVLAVLLETLFWLDLSHDSSLDGDPEQAPAS